MTTHCKSCKQKQPEIGLLRESFDSDEVALWGVSTDLEENSLTLARYVDEHRPNYRVLTELPREQRKALRSYVLDAFKDDLTPVSLVTDVAGRILLTVPGIPSVSDLRRLLYEMQG